MIRSGLEQGFQPGIEIAAELHPWAAEVSSMKWFFPIAAIFLGVVLFCMGVLSAGVYHGIPYLEPRRGTFAGADNTPWQLATLSGPERMMLWGMVVAGCGVVGTAGLAMVGVVRFRGRRSD
jgi:hypothetical protein